MSHRMRYARSTHDHVGVSLRHSGLAIGITFFFLFYLFFSKVNDYGHELGFLKASCYFKSVNFITRAEGDELRIRLRSFFSLFA